MNKYIFFLSIVLTTSSLFTQYWCERVTEQSFEQSDLYFTSYYLNTFGLYRFREVAVGLVDDPFLDLYLNPANLPDLSKGNLLHLDFRGDRTSVPISDDYRIHPLGGPLNWVAPVYIDPRWYNTSRRDPEPVFSAGFLSYLMNAKSQSLFLGGTYQLIYKQEKFYTMPSWIYFSRFGYDAFNNQISSFYNYPVQDRYAGKDEMLHQGHLFSVFLGSRVHPKISLGISVNGVVHSRDGIYYQFQHNEYGSTNDYDWQLLNEIQRNQNYHHLDLAMGLEYQYKPDFILGTKGGFLNGDADQDYTTVYYSQYAYQDRYIPENMGSSFSDSQTRQLWDQKGQNWYGSVNLTKILKDQNQVNFYYRYTNSDIDHQNRSQIVDTSFYESNWIGDTLLYQSLYESSLADYRNGSGMKQLNWHQALFNLRYKLGQKSSLSLGFYYSHKNSEIRSTEPAVIERSSEHQENSPYNWKHYLFEDKILDWYYSSIEWSLQIPLIFDFNLSPHWSLSIGLNKILQNWKIEETTVSYFTTRQRLENDSLRVATNFAERYIQPSQKITEEYTDLISKISVNISPAAQVELLINPEFEDTFRIAQWWLVFRMVL
jgi:hypothetical protein